MKATRVKIYKSAYGCLAVERHITPAEASDIFNRWQGVWNLLPFGCELDHALGRNRSGRLVERKVYKYRKGATYQLKLITWAHGTDAPPDPDLTGTLPVW